MVPSGKLTDIVGGVIAKYSGVHEIELYGWIVLSNHYHLLCRAPKGNLWKFGQDINREISKRVNRLLKREGSLWGRRYSDQIVLEECDQIEALLYILSNAVKHGLVSDPKNWPGLSSLETMRTGKFRSYPFTNYTAFHRAKLSDPTVKLKDFTEYYELRLSLLPALRRLQLSKSSGKSLVHCSMNAANSFAPSAGKKGGGF